MAQHVKGSILLARLAYLDDKHGPKAREEILRALSPEDREILAAEILPGSWYHRDIFSRLVDTIIGQYGEGDRVLARRMGYHAAGLQLSGAYDTLYRPGDPGFIIGRAGNIWQLFHDFGDLDGKLLPSNRCSFHLRQLDGPDIDLVQGLIGWIQKAIELSGGKKIRWRYDAVSPKNNSYRILISWET